MKTERFSFGEHAFFANRWVFPKAGSHMEELNSSACEKFSLDKNGELS